MVPKFIKRLYEPRYMVREHLKLGDIPGTKEVFSTAFSVAWASIAESFLISLISMADTVMVSTVGEQAIAAVGLVTQPRFIVQTLVLALNVAVTSICARRKGEGDAYSAASCLKQGLILTAIFSVVLPLATIPFAQPLLRFAGAQDDTIVMATDYFLVLLAGMPFCNISLTISAAQRGIGNTRASMRINMISNIVNLVFNYLLIGGNFGFPRLGVKGAAIATVLGWIVGLVMALLSVSNKSHFLFIYSRDGWKFQKSTLSSMYKVASGSFFEQICMRAGFMTTTKIIAGLGTMMLAAHQILANLLNLSFAFGEGYGVASSSLVGQSLGAKRSDMSIVYGKACQRMSIITSTFIFI
ncbi:MAG: MATE family efflux transporter, partial [Oscillospiraceae bacterium]|nr:MATE family efflux transporter [Oscillospiraceae bacterium]